MWRRSKLAEALSHPIIRKNTSRLHSADCSLAPRSSLKPVIGRSKGKDSFFGPYEVGLDERKGIHHCRRMRHTAETIVGRTTPSRWLTGVTDIKRNRTWTRFKSPTRTYVEVVVISLTRLRTTLRRPFTPLIKTRRIHAVGFGAVIRMYITRSVVMCEGSCTKLSFRNPKIFISR